MLTNMTLNHLVFGMLIVGTAIQLIDVAWYLQGQIVFEIDGKDP